MGSTCFFVDLSEEKLVSNAKPVSSEPSNLLMVRKPGTPTKRQSANSNWGEENKTLLGNRLGSQNANIMKPTEMTAQLPKRLQRRLDSLPKRPSAETILRKEELVLQKREQMIKEKVEEQKYHEEKCQVVRARKKDYEKNMILLGNCVPSNLREIKPVVLPGKLAKRMAQLKSISATRLSLEEKMNGASARRQSLLKGVTYRQQFHGSKVREIMTKKNTIRRFDEIPAYLPEKLKKRLESFRRPTTQVLLRKEQHAEKKRELILLARSESMKAHMFKVSDVQQTRSEFIANKVDFHSLGATPIKLPARLAQRAELLKPKCTEASILMKEARAVKKRAALLAQTKAKAHAHLEHAKELYTLKNSVPRYEQIPSNIPLALRKRLESFRVPTPTSILRKEELCAVRAKLHKEAVIQKAKEHMISVNKATALKKQFNKNNMILATTFDSVAKPVYLPRKFQARLASLAESKPTPEVILRKEATAIANHEKFLEGIVAFCTEHLTKVEKLKLSKQQQPIFEEIPSYLPQNLQDRLRSLKRPTNEAILRKNDVAFVRARTHTIAKANTATMHLASVKEVISRKQQMNASGLDFSCKETTPFKLPEALANRAKKLAPKWNTTVLLDKEEQAKERRMAFIKARKSSAATHNKIVVLQRLGNHVKQPRFETVPEFLPEKLKERLATITRPTNEAILRKEVRATIKHQMAVETIRQNARFHGFQVNETKELHDSMVENEVDFSGRATEKISLPKRLLARMATFSPTKTDKVIFAKEQAAVDKHNTGLKAIRRKAKEHTRVVKERMIAKTTKPRFETIPEGLPKNLRERLESIRRPSDKSILNKHEFASVRAKLAIDTKAYAAKLHLLHVEDVLKTRDNYRDNMEIMTKEHLTPVKLPEKLELRLAELKHKSPTKEGILTRESKVAARGAKFLKERSDKAHMHNMAVRTKWELKKTKPRFSEQDIKSLPVNLKNRLRTFRTPTKEAIQNKEKRAQQRHNNQLAAKVDMASKHAMYVEKVKKLKAEFAKNNIQFIGSPTDDRVESSAPSTVQNLPPSLKLRLEHSASKFHSPTKQEMLDKQSAVENHREALLRERVSKSRTHSAKVMKVMQEKKRMKQQQFGNNQEEEEQVPETN